MGEDGQEYVITWQEREDAHGYAQELADAHGYPGGTAVQVLYLRPGSSTPSVKKRPTPFA